MKKGAWGLSCIIGTILSGALAYAADTPARGTINPLLSIYGTTQQGSKWETNRIPVCWENAEPENYDLRILTQSAVASTWEANSAVKFTDWSPCEINPKGIRIWIADEGPRVEVLGRYLAGRPKGMVLNFTFGVVQRDCQDTVEDCVRKMAVHEFGHALGLAHEHHRNEASTKCKDEIAGNRPDIIGDKDLTKYDPQSVMNYCSSSWLGNGQLTELDIEAIQVLYGRTF